MNVESVLDLTDLLLIQQATLQKVGIPFQSNDLNYYTSAKLLFLATACLIRAIHSR